MKTLNELLNHDPSKIALIDQDKILTYQELSDLSSQLASYLLEEHMTPGNCVVVKMKKSWKAVVVLLAILKTRSCFIFVDPNLPKSQQEKIISTCNAVKILEDLPENFEQKIHNPLPKVLPTDLCYYYFTTGSTGEAKIACFDHQRAMNFVTWAVDFFNFHESDRVGSVSSFSFDISILDIFVTFSVGATLVLVPDSIKLFKVNCKNYLKEHQITFIQTVPALWDELYDIELPTLKNLVFTGQNISQNQFKQLQINLPKNYSQAKLYNLYGQTEANSYLCYLFSLKNDDYPVAIAKLPLPTYVNIIDHELWIFNHTLMKNYLGNLPISKFNTKDLVKIENEKLYWLGRADNMIKVKGHRLSPEEIELVLNQVVAASCVFYHDVLYAVLEVKDHHGNFEQEIKKHCQQYLSPYQIPEKIIFVKELSKNQNGKIDRKKVIASFSS